MQPYTNGMLLRYTLTAYVGCQCVVYVLPSNLQWADMILMYFDTEQGFYKHVDSIADQDHGEERVNHPDAVDSNGLESDGKPAHLREQVVLPSLEKSVDSKNGNDTHDTNIYEKPWVRMISSWSLR